MWRECAARASSPPWKTSPNRYDNGDSRRPALPAAVRPHALSPRRVRGTLRALPAAAGAAQFRGRAPHAARRPGLLALRPRGVRALRLALPLGLGLRLPGDAALRRRGGRTAGG